MLCGPQEGIRAHSHMNANLLGDGHLLDCDGIACNLAWSRHHPNGFRGQRRAETRKAARRPGAGFGSAPDGRPAGSARPGLDDALLGHCGPGHRRVAEEGHPQLAA
jgi:hypothetical protein